MFAIIADGGRQYKVQRGDRLVLDFRKTAKVDDVLKFEQVLLAGNAGGLQIGRPLLAGAVVEAKVLGHRKGHKLEIQKFKRRKKIRRHTGHRQNYTAVQIQSVTVPGLVEEAAAN